MRHENITVLSDGSANGVAPHADPLAHEDLLKILVDDQCLWLARHASGWQFGEQGIIEAIINRLEEIGEMPEAHRCAIEFGAGDGGNTPVTVANIALRQGWKSLLIEADADKCRRLSKRFPTARVVTDRVTVDGESSIDTHIAKSELTTTPAVMVVDIDSYEYYIVKSMKARPYVLCIETLDHHHNKSTRIPYIPTIEECGNRFDLVDQLSQDYTFRKQASASATDFMMHDLGYKLVYRTRVNGVYVRNDIAIKIRKKCLNLGCGDSKLQGHDNLDIKTGTDIRKLDYHDFSVDEVYASHVLEHFGAEETHQVLKEWVRVLKPGGIIRIAVPDLRKAMAEIQKEEPITGHANLQSVLFGSRSDPTDRHQIGFVRETLSSWMYGAGIGMIHEFESFAKDSSSTPYSLNLAGIKRWWPKVEDPKVCVVLNQPRLAFTGHEKCLIKLAQKLKFEVQESFGAMWDRDMTLAVQAAAVKYDPHFYLFTDYDSVFEEDDVRVLLETINNDPTMAAIGAVQPSRHDDRPLVMDNKLDYSGDITKVTFQHFGLMVIRREVFEELEQPWFWSVPGKDANGNWDWNAFARSDADITFWRNLDLIGFNVYQHNKVNIGHIIQAIKYVRNKGHGVQFIPIENYWRHGKPKDAIFVADLYRPADLTSDLLKSTNKEPENGAVVDRGRGHIGSEGQGGAAAGEQHVCERSDQCAVAD